MERRDFVKTCSLACIGGTAMAALLQACVNPNYIAQTSVQNNQILLNKNEFAGITNGKEVHRKYVLVRSEKFNFPICVYKLNEENYSALLMECTHKGCELRPQGDHLLCPCHGSEFSNKGIVQSPPAEENLRTFQVKTDHETIYIQL